VINTVDGGNAVTEMTEDAEIEFRLAKSGAEPDLSLFILYTRTAGLWRTDSQYEHPRSIDLRAHDRANA
jgi:hypothetical protein